MKRMTVKGLLYQLKQLPQNAYIEICPHRQDTGEDWSKSIVFHPVLVQSITCSDDYGGRGAILINAYHPRSGSKTVAINDI